MEETIPEGAVQTTLDDLLLIIGRLTAQNHALTKTLAGMRAAQSGQKPSPGTPDAG